MTCYRCGAALDSFDTGCHRKLINRAAEECLCRSCLCLELGISRERLEEMIVRFRRQGCTLFPPLDRTDGS